MDDSSQLIKGLCKKKTVADNDDAYTIVYLFLG